MRFLEGELADIFSRGRRMRIYATYCSLMANYSQIDIDGVTEVPIEIRHFAQIVSTTIRGIYIFPVPS